MRRSFSEIWYREFIKFLYSSLSSSTTQQKRNSKLDFKRYPRVSGAKIPKIRVADTDRIAAFGYKALV